MALPYVWEAILSAEAIPSLTTVPPTAGTAVGVAEAEQVSLYRQTCWEHQPFARPERLHALVFCFLDHVELAT